MLTDIRALADHFLIALPNINKVHYRGINIVVTYANYHCAADYGTFTSKPSLGTMPTLRNITLTK